VGRYSPELLRLVVKGPVAYAGARGAGPVQLLRRHGHWRISQFDRYGWYEPCRLRVCAASPPSPGPRPSPRPAPRSVPVPPSTGPAIAPAMVHEHCTIVWVGPRRGSWSRRRNWSPRREPMLVDEACVPRGRTVTVASGRHQAGALIDGGTLEMRGGTLELASPRTASEVSVVRVHRGATVYGSQNLIAVNGLVRLGGRMTGGSGAPAGGPPLTPCGPHSPPGLPDCAAAPDPVEAEINRTWNRFVRRVRAGRDPGGLIAARVCQKAPPYDAPPPRLRVRPAGCRRMLRDVRRTFAKYPTDLRNLSIRGGWATALSLATSETRFERHHGRWRIIQLLNYGWSKYD
jgi:hypothetical protein